MELRAAREAGPLVAANARVPTPAALGALEQETVTVSVCKKHGRALPASLSSLPPVSLSLSLPASLEYVDLIIVIVHCTLALWVLILNIRYAPKNAHKQNLHAP